jgi:hypothetical protein
MTMKLVLIILAAAVVGCAQDKQRFDPFPNPGPDEVTFDRFPHPYLMPSLNLNGGGFQAASGSMTGGVMYELPFLSIDAHGTYNAARKVFDGTGDNPHGNVRSLNGSVFVRLPNRLWMVGGNYGYGVLATTNYHKASGGWGVGAGRDFLLSDTSFRLTATYSPPQGPEHSPSAGDRAQGLTMTFMLPSPITNHRVYFYQLVSASRYRDGGTSGGMHMGVLVRF